MRKAKYPEKHIKKGNFILHSGQKSNFLIDVNSLLSDNFYLSIILEKIPLAPHYVGIATGGAIIGRILSKENGVKFSMVKDGELKGEIPEGDYLLVDDVVTTGNSLKEAIKIIGKQPKQIWVVLDRRKKNQIPKVNSIFVI